MNIIVPRTCIEIPPRDEAHNREQKPCLLAAFRSVPAYVLLGDPGSGKTTAFEVEREALGENACLITARDFLALNMDSHPEWPDKTLFIDGLDEVRAGTADVRTPFDAIRGRLGALGKPRFRLSCREADWLGANDRKHLTSVVQDSQVTVLRLNPLRDADVAIILNARPDVPDAGAFITAARKQGVDGLLTNPQTLKMLADVVGGGGWPESRKETFEMACRQMVREPNEEHQAARELNNMHAPAQLLSAAGRLCAVQLISGAAGYTLSPGQPNTDYPALNQCDSDGSEMLRRALSTKLFKAETINRFTPAHRHIAEFLGARYLAQLVDDGLPAYRVLALMTGGDGGVVTEMRGLSAWLAAQCRSVRMALIERDPIGVGLYGDLRHFLPEEKRTLLNALKRAGDRLGSDLASRHWPAAFGPLVTADMESALREILTDPARDEQHQILAVFVLRILEEGPPLPELSTPLLDMARDETRSPRVNALALHTFLHTCPDGQDKTSQLKVLLADIQAGRVADPEDELIGTLLTRLYPRDLPASEVWDYLSESDGPNLMSGSFWFWSRGLLEQSSDKEVSELLDRLLCPPPGVQRALETPRPYLENLVLNLLARGLQADGDNITTKRLYDWLGVGIQYNDHEASRDVRAWLEQRPEIQKKIVVEGFQRAAQSPSGNPNGEISWVRRHLYGANPPSNFGLWCGEQAKKATDLQIVEYFIRSAEQARLSLEDQREQASDHPALQSLISEMIDRSKAKEQEYQCREQSYTEERRRQEEEWLAHVRSNEAALRENRAAPLLLHQLAITCLDSYPSSGPEALRQKLGGDQALIDAALRGLRGVVDRDDVPDRKKILDLYQKNYQHYLSLPFLVGLVEIERATPTDLSQWDDSRLCMALAFYFCTPFPGGKPQWYQRLLATRPELVADVQVQYARVALRSGREVINDLQELAHAREHVDIARHASLPLLRAFPTRCKVNQLSHLDNLLWAALQHADKASLEELIERKLSRPSMNTPQRVHWLAAGLVVSPAGYRDCLSDFVRDQQNRIEHVATFFCDRPSYSQSEVPVELGIPVVKFLICLIGSYSEPDPRLEEEPMPSSMKAARVVYTFVQHLATSPAQDASEALAALCTDQGLIGWQDVLKQARDSQGVIRRDAGYQHPDIEQVCRTLHNGDPANAADLAALVMDRLREIAVQIRTGNTDDWRQYWNENSYGRPCSPKPENSCRDALLSDLRQRLPHGADAQPEGEYANDRRSDIRVSCRDFQVPVEVKRNKHRELWRACKDQLIKQYTSDPATNGYGIYLVFWFGKDHTQPPPSGTRPDSPTVLEEQLKATLSEDGARKISVCVIDVSNPKE